MIASSISRSISPMMASVLIERLSTVSLPRVTGLNYVTSGM